MKALLIKILVMKAAEKQFHVHRNVRMRQKAWKADKMKKLVIFGLGDLAELAWFYFVKDSGYRPAAFTADGRYRNKEEFLGLPVYDFEQIQESCPPGEYDMFIAAGYSRLNQVREEKYYAAKKKGYRLASYISTRAVCWPDRGQIGDNCMILENCTVQPFVQIGNNVIIWSGSQVAHHSRIGEHVFLASHAVLSGRTCVGNNCFIGANAAVCDKVVIGKDCVIGAGALVTRDTQPGTVYKGQYSCRDEKVSGEIAYFFH